MSSISLVYASLQPELRLRCQRFCVFASDVRNEASSHRLSPTVLCGLLRGLIRYLIFLNPCMVEDSSYYYDVFSIYELLSSFVNLTRNCLLGFAINVSYFLNSGLRVEEDDNRFLISRYIQCDFQSVRDPSVQDRLCIFERSRWLNSLELFLARELFESNTADWVDYYLHAVFQRRWSWACVWARARHKTIM